MYHLCADWLWCLSIIGETWTSFFLCTCHLRYVWFAVQVVWLLLLAYTPLWGAVHVV